MRNGSFDFAVKILEAIARWGDLTVNQQAAVDRCVAREAQRSQERQAAAQARSTEIDCTKVVQAFGKAMENGLKRPKLIVAGIKFSLAPLSGRNAGAIYVKAVEADQYLGKIVDDKYLPTREVSQEQVAQVVLIAAHPGEAARFTASRRASAAAAVCRSPTPRASSWASARSAETGTGSKIKGASAPFFI
jgi:hypothetical protein